MWNLNAVYCLIFPEMAVLLYVSALLKIIHIIQHLSPLSKIIQFVTGNILADAKFWAESH